MKSFKVYMESIVSRYATPYLSVEYATKVKHDELQNAGHEILRVYHNAIEHSKDGQRFKSKAYLHHTGEVWNKTEKI